MDSSRWVSDVSNTFGEGELDICEGRIRLFLGDTLECVSESIMLQKNAQGSRRRRISPLLLHALVMPLCSDRPRNAVSQVERRHSHAAPGLGGRVCVVVGDEDGNRHFFICFQ